MRPFRPNTDDISRRIVARVMAMPEAEVDGQLGRVLGAMRKHCLGAFLLDQNDPPHVIRRLREGYVPNVVYTCGALLHRRELIVPYAMSDSAISFASVHLDELPAAME